LNRNNRSSLGTCGNLSFAQMRSGF